MTMKTVGALAVAGVVAILIGEIDGMPESMAGLLHLVGIGCLLPAICFGNAYMDTFRRPIGETEYQQKRRIRARQALDLQL